MTFSDKKMAEDESGGQKRSRKKQKKEDVWRSEGPKDPVAMVCIFEQYSYNDIKPIGQQPV